MSEPIIIGGGIAGLAAAWELTRRGRRPVVLERSTRPGGVILTERIDGFVIDAGPDALLVQKPAAIELCRELGLGERLFPTLTPRTAFIVKHGRLVPLPEASVLGIPTRLAPFVTTRLFSWAGKARMAAEAVIPPRRDEEDESIASFMRRRFGEEAVTWLAEPLLAGIHAGDVERLSMRALFPRLVDAERRSGSVLRSLRSMRTPPASNGAFLSLPGGLGELVETLVARLPEGVIRYGAEVSRIEGRGPFRVTLTSGETLESRAVIVAAPARTAAGMIAPIDPESADLCRGIRAVSSATVVFGVRRDRVGHPLAGSGFVVPRQERRAVMAASFVSSKWPHRAPAGFVLVRGFVGGAHDPDVLQRPDEAIARAVWDDLSARLDITGDAVLTRVYRWPLATPQHDVGHQARIAALEARLACAPGLFVTGSSYHGSGIPDAVANARATAVRAATLA
jgi:oxygen-dependent protoporphyrinogen oxidase